MCSVKKEDETGYIKKADAIREAVRESAECVMSDEYTEADSAKVGEVVARVIYTLQTMLPADVAPVRHGRWVVIDAEEPRRYGCSECKRLSWNMENYCGNCGAKMDR